MHAMKKHLAWFYGRLAKASVPKASSPKWTPFLPRLIAAPDLPISKHSKEHTRDVTINNGIHWHGLALDLSKIYRRAALTMTWMKERYWTECWPISCRAAFVAGYPLISGTSGTATYISGPDMTNRQAMDLVMAKFGTLTP
jgi:hypothetical protein